MPIVEVNGQEIEFPDDMGQDQIKAVLQKKFSSTEAPATPERTFAQGVLKGIEDPALGLGQLVPRGISAVTSGFGAFPNKVSDFYAQDAGRMDALAKEREAAYQAKGTDEGVDWGRVAGNVVSPVNAIVGMGAGMLPKASGVLGRVAQGVGVGGAYAGTAPVTGEGDFSEQKMKQVGSGMIAGGAIPLAGEAVARVIKPKVTEAAQKLMDEGIQLTPGQMKGGMAQRVEDSLTSIPLLGDAIKGAQRRSIEGLNKAVANRALSPIGEKVPDNIPAGREMAAYVSEKLRGEYKKLLPNMIGKVDDQFADDLANLTEMAQFMPEQQARQFNNILQKELYRKVSPNGSITGESLKEVESALAREAKNYLKDVNADQRNLGAALEEVVKSFRGMLTRVNPDHAEKLSAINRGYANYARLRDAAASVGAKEGVFSPTQLNQAIRRGDSTVAKGGYAQGKALMQDLSDAAKSTLPQTVPDSGTPLRALVNMLMLGGGAYVNPVGAGVGLGAAGMYTKPGLKIAELLMASRPAGAQALADKVRIATSPGDLSRLLMAGSRPQYAPSAP